MFLCILTMTCHLVTVISTNIFAVHFALIYLYCYFFWYYSFCTCKIQLVRAKHYKHLFNIQSYFYNKPDRRYSCKQETDLSANRPESRCLLCCRHASPSPSPLLPYTLLTHLSPPGSMEEGTVGEISIQVDLYTHPGTGEQRINVKGVPHSNSLLTCCVGKSFECLKSQITALIQDET